MNEFWAVILAAGQSSRMGNRIKKQFLIWKNRPLFWHSVLVFSRIPKIRGIILVLPKSHLAELEKEIYELSHQDLISLPLKLVAGGKNRQESSWNGISAVPSKCSHVLIHDAARPFVTPYLINRIISSLESGNNAVIPGIKPKDTVKQKKNGKVITIPRDTLYLIQTPQGFALKLIKKAYELMNDKNIDVTDDASLVEKMGEKVVLLDGEENNIKITTQKDLIYLKEEDKKKLCTGFGYDVHRFGNGKPLKLGGIKVSDSIQVVAHSDGDVLLHALIDAILGCISKGDIGDHFPDTDPKFKDIHSGILLSEVLTLALKEGFTIEHVDVLIITQVPKISPYKTQIRRNIANILGIELDCVNIKATTEEGLGFTGEKKGIKCVVQVIGYKKVGD